MHRQHQLRGWDCWEQAHEQDANPSGHPWTAQALGTCDGAARLKPEELRTHTVDTNLVLLTGPPLLGGQRRRQGERDMPFIKSSISLLELACARSLTRCGWCGGARGARRWIVRSCSKRWRESLGMRVQCAHLIFSARQRTTGITRR